jgi:putative DNA primase/helicase
MDKKEKTGRALTDAGNAERLIDDHGDRLRYVHDCGHWLVWDGKRWRKDATREIVRLAVETVRGIYKEAAAAEDPEERKKLAVHARKSEDRRRIDSMLLLARADVRVSCTQADLDQDGFLLNVMNGTLDLRMFTLREHQREDLLTHCLPVGYDPHTTCPTWLQFLGRIFANDQELMDYVHRAVGYSLTGSTQEHVLFLLHGAGANGKSTFLETLRKLLGTLAKQSGIETFLTRKYVGIPNDIARLKGARLATAVEADSGRNFAEANLKLLTGGDTVTARFLYNEHFEFRPRFKLWIATNHRPRINSVDNAIWRRIQLIPFGVTIPKDEQDLELGKKLEHELPGILAWAVEGCRQWRDQGLGTVDTVEEATYEYRRDCDPFSRWIAECCELAPELEVAAASLHLVYKRWAWEYREAPPTQKALGKRLRESGLTSKKVNGCVRWVGIAIKPEWLEIHQISIRRQVTV